MPASSSLLSGAPTQAEPAAASAVSAPSTPSPPPPGVPAASTGGQRSSTLTVIAGVGVLLLAMGVGVLIGRAGSSKQSVAPPQIITVASPASSGGTAPAEASFSGDWPAGGSGYTVQLQTLPETGTTVSAVEAAKTAAGGKGATAVGALKSSEFTSLTSGDYVIYSGDFHKKAEAEKALKGLKKSFPQAKVVHVASGGSTSSSEGSEPSASSPGGVGYSETKPAKVKSVKTLKGKTYEEKSKNLPDVVETG